MRTIRPGENEQLHKLWFLRLLCCSAIIPIDDIGGKKKEKKKYWITRILFSHPLIGICRFNHQIFSWLFCLQLVKITNKHLVLVTFVTCNLNARNAKAFYTNRNHWNKALSRWNGKLLHKGIFYIAFVWGSNELAELV